MTVIQEVENYKIITDLRQLSPSYVTESLKFYKTLTFTLAGRLTHFQPMFQIWRNQVVGFY